MTQQSQPVVNHRHTKRSITKSTSLLVPVMMTRILINSHTPPITVAVHGELNTTLIKTNTQPTIMAETQLLLKTALHNQTRTIITGMPINLTILVMVNLITEIMVVALALHQHQTLLVTK